MLKKSTRVPLQIEENLDESLEAMALQKVRTPCLDLKSNFHKGHPQNQIPNQVRPLWSFSKPTQFTSGAESNTFADSQKPATPSQSAGRKLVFVVVHGLEAAPLDMRVVRAAILANVPNSLVHLARANQNLTNDSIQDQGLRLAQELGTLLSTHCISGTLR